MQNFSVVLLFIASVMWSNCQEIKLTSYTNDNDTWIWGYTDSKIEDKIFDDNTSNTTTPKNNTNPCDPFFSDKPKFTGRISEIKCQEHIWQLKYDAEKRIHESRCELWKIKQNTANHEEMQVPGIIGGFFTYPGQYPHMGAIGWKGVATPWRFLCGSSLISPNFVLTAAHCSSVSAADTSVEDTTPKIVRFKAINLFSRVEDDVNILRIIVHPNYESPKKNYDIALMELERQVKLNVLAQPACLWTKPVMDYSDTVTITGWGVIQKNSIDFSKDLQVAAVDIIEDSSCSEYLSKFCNRHWCGLQDHQFCAGKLAGGVDACQGDSGGPLQVKIPLPDYVHYNIYYIIGVTSFGVSCAEPGLPGIYSKVSSFLDWIEPIVWP